MAVQEISCSNMQGETQVASIFATRKCLGARTLKRVQVPTLGATITHLCPYRPCGATFQGPIWVSGDQILVIVVSIS
jgi:hypothetical protein